MLSDAAVQDLPVSSSTLELLTNFYANMYGQDPAQMEAIVACESNFDQYAKNINPPKEKSYGLVQINVLANTKISVQQAFNPFFALNYLAENLAEGHASMWLGSKKCWQPLAVAYASGNGSP